MNLEALADEIRAEHHDRLLEPKQLPKEKRRWKRRPTPKTAIIGESANWLADDWKQLGTIS